MGDVGANPQPVRGQVVISGPGLEVTRGRNQFWRRKPQEFPARQLNLRPEEVVIRRKVDGRNEMQCDQDFFFGNRALAAGEWKSGSADRRNAAFLKAVRDREG